MQNWNDVLEYIKINLGAQINMLEINDDDMIKVLKNQVLTYFSQFSPAKKYCMINHSDLKENIKTGEPTFNYKIPLVDDNDYIIDILDCYISTASDLTSATSYNYSGTIDSVIANSYNDALKSLQVRNTWDFHPPRHISFDLEIRSAVIVYNIVHKLLETIKPDMYQMVFKPLCLANVKLWIASLRSKYSGLQTPFGTIELNWQALQQEGLQEKDKYDQMLMGLPPDHLIHVSV